jgi:flagellar basal body-associated protein FliL
MPGTARAARRQPAAIFYQLDPLAAPVIVDGRVKRQVLLTLSVQVSDLSAKNDLVAVMPRLRDAMLRELYRKPVVRNDGDGTINIDSVKTRMLAVAQGMLSAAKVQDVLIVKAIQVG